MSEKIDDLTETFIDSIPCNLTGEEKETFKTNATEYDSIYERKF